MANPLHICMGFLLAVVLNVMFSHLMVSTGALYGSPWQQMCKFNWNFAKLHFNPPCQSYGRFEAHIFCRKRENSSKTAFRFWKLIFWQRLWSKIILKQYSNGNHSKSWWKLGTSVISITVLHYYIKWFIFTEQLPLHLCCQGLPLCTIAHCTTNL